MPGRPDRSRLTRPRSTADALALTPADLERTDSDRLAAVAAGLLLQALVFAAPRLLSLLLVALFGLWLYAAALLR